MRVIDQGQHLLEVTGVDLDSAVGRPLFRGLNLSLGQERVAIVGRNGVGKSALLEMVVGALRPVHGDVRLSTEPFYVPQALPAESGSAGEVRRAHLEAARRSNSKLLVLDEPSQDLDAHSRAWLVEWLRRWPSGLLLVSHDRALLRGFRDFFIIAESGCRHLSGTLKQLEAALERDQEENQRRYVQRLNLLLQHEQHSEKYRRRRERKKNVGRVRELGRMTPRSRLNQKRSYAQEKQGRIERIRQTRLEATREWAKAARRALTVALPLQATMPRLPAHCGPSIVTLARAGVRVGGRWLFSGLQIELGHDRLALTGPNGAGKTTILDLMLGNRAPTSGRASRDRSRIGSIAQGGSDWMLEESLLEHLIRMSDCASEDAAARLLVAHRFPLALAERSMASLSPGERVRAALIGLLRRDPPVDLLVLDEPTYALDFTGAKALGDVLRSWPGGLVVVSHDHNFLDAARMEHWLELDGQGRHRFQPAR